MLDDSTLLVAERIGFAYPGGSMLFTDVDLVLHRGDLIALTGPSGRGKSTLLSIIAGVQRPTRGEARWKEGLSTVWVMQTPIGAPATTAQEHVATVVAATMHCAWPEALDRAAALLRQVRLDSRLGIPYGKLSGGEAQRLMLARAMAAQPDVMLLDEPTAQLDRTAAQLVAEIIDQTTSTGAAVVLATHDRELASRCPQMIEL